MKVLGLGGSATCAYQKCFVSRSIGGTKLVPTKLNGYHCPKCKTKYCRQRPKRGKK